MRVNIYSQELTSEVQLVEKRDGPDAIYSAVMFMLHSSSMLHADPAGDDRSGVTFWMPKSRSRREEMAKTFEEAARLVRSAPAETAQ